MLEYEKVYTVCEKSYGHFSTSFDWFPMTTWSTRSGAEEQLKRLKAAARILGDSYLYRDKWSIQEVEVDPK